MSFQSREGESLEQGDIASFNTPPWTEGLNWNVMTHTMTVSEDQVQQFREILQDVSGFPTNNRPVQPLNGRTVTERKNGG